MADKINITSQQENGTYSLVLNESVLLLDKNDSITFPLEYGNLKWKLIVKFIDDDSIPKYNASLTFGELKVIYTVNKWDSDSSVESTKPVKFYSKNKNGEITNEFYLKLKSVAPLNHNFRQVFISVWKKM